MSSPLPSPPRERMIVYIDGFNLYHAIHDEFGRTALWLDVVQLAMSLRREQKLVAVRYFTADILGDPQGQSRQAHYINALQALYPNVFEVVRGRYQNKDMTCHSCGSCWRTHEEKETDVNIAVRLVMDAALHSMDTAIIISGDSDLSPAVRAVRSLNSSIFVTAAFPPNRVSDHLRQLMPASFTIGKSKFRTFQLPSTFEAGGRTFTRPEKWDDPI